MRSHELLRHMLPRERPDAQRSHASPHPLSERREAALDELSGQDYADKHCLEESHQKDFIKEVVRGADVPSEFAAKPLVQALRA
jgi:hypothetical protein